MSKTCENCGYRGAPIGTAGEYYWCDCGKTCINGSPWKDKAENIGKDRNKMSGGRFNYQDISLKREIYGWTDVPNNIFEDREVSELVWDVFDLIHDYDLYAEGDTCRETYLKSKAEFKKKWFSNRGVCVRRIVDNAIEQCKKELYDTFNLDDNYLVEKENGK